MLSERQTHMLEEESSDSDGMMRPAPAQGRCSTARPAVVLVASLCAAAAVLGVLCHVSGKQAPLKSQDLATTRLHLNHNMDPCAQMPLVSVSKVIHSNLGGGGPDSGPEGLVFAAHARRAGLSSEDVDVELHFHAQGDFKLAQSRHGPKRTGISGHFAQITVEPGKKGIFTLFVTHPGNDTKIMVPRIALTFFDIDAGRDGVRSAEYITISGYTNYYLTNSTGINVTHKHNGAKFGATHAGSFNDNPTKPLELTKRQKDHTVSFEFDNMESITFELGVSPGVYSRSFDFVYQAALRCAATVLEDGTMLAPDDPNSPVAIVRSGGNETAYDSQGYSGEGGETNGTNGTNGTNETTETTETTESGAVAACPAVAPFLAVLALARML